MLSGDFVTGAPMTVTAGTWSRPPAKLTMSYEWVSLDGKIRATGRTFTPGKDHIGATVTVVITASAPGYATVRTRHTAPTPVRAPDPTQTTAPAVTGAPVVGTKAYVRAGMWSDRTWLVKNTFQWLRGGVSIPGATGTEYTAVGADFGRKLSVAVTSTLDGRILKTQTVNASMKVAVGTPSPRS